METKLLLPQDLNNICTMENKESILVTGGSGMVGKALDEELENRTSQFRENYKFVFLSSKDGDLTDPIKTKSIFKFHKPTYVINLAARVGGLFANMSDNDSFYRINTMINANVLLCSNEMRVNKCISCLSTCIFPDKIDYPLDETKIHLGPPHASNSGYSLAKRQVDILNRQYNESGEGKTLFTAIIPTNIYGCHDNFNLEESHVIPSLIHKAYLGSMDALENNRLIATLRVCGSGKPLRQFIYAPDLAKLILWTMEHYNNPEPLILAPDESDEVSIGHIAEIIAKIFSDKYKLKMSVYFDTNYSDGQYKKTASNRKLRNLNTEFRFTPLESSIRKVIDWFCSKYPNVRL